MVASIFVDLDGAPQGPFTAEELSALWRAGEIDERARYWARGMREWALVSAFSPPAALSAADLLVSAAQQMAGRTTVADDGIIACEAVVAGDALDDLLASLREAGGGRVAATENLVRQARESVLSRLRAEAARRGCDGVIATRLEQLSLGRVVLVAASGSAVRLGPPPVSVNA